MCHWISDEVTKTDWVHCLVTINLITKFSENPYGSLFLTLNLDVFTEVQIMGYNLKNGFRVRFGLRLTHLKFSENVLPSPKKWDSNAVRRFQILDIMLSHDNHLKLNARIL